MPSPTPTRRFVVGISGASGAAYALRLIEQLLLGGHEVHLVVSQYGRRLLLEEAGVRRLVVEELAPAAVAAVASAPADSLAAPERRLVVHPHQDVGAAIASGSFIHHGMVVIPCASTTLGAIANGCGSNLLVRAALVALKERRPLILCHRETPLSLVDIDNYRRAALAGAIVCPTNPGFYLHPCRIEDLVDFMVAKVLDLLKVEHALLARWPASRTSPSPRLSPPASAPSAPPGVPGIPPVAARPTAAPFGDEET